MRTDEGRRKEERFSISVVGVVMNPAARFNGNLFIILGVDTATHCSGIEDRLHGMVPGYPDSRIKCPVTGPRKVCRIDIRGDPILETMELVSADEMHLARETGVVAHDPQIVRQSRDLRLELAGVVIDVNATR